MKQTILQAILTEFPQWESLDNDEIFDNYAELMLFLPTIAKYEVILTQNILDKTNPMCEPPKTGNEEHDGILKKVWDWANDPANKGKLKDTFTKVKSALSQAKKESKGGEISEQLAPIIIGGLAISPGILIAVGIFILIILIVAMIPKKSGCQKWKTIDDLV